MVDLTEGALPATSEAPPDWAFDVWGENAAYCEECKGWHHIAYHERPKSRRVRFSFAWYDLWVGAYYDRTKRTWYVCPLPMLLIEVRRRAR